MGYHSPNYYVINLGHGLVNPLDSTTYYWGGHIGYAMTTSATGNQVIVPYKGVIRRITMKIYNSSQNCTAEDDTFSVRINDTTDYALYTGTAATGDYDVSGLAIPVNASDKLAIKEVTPAWATNPLSTYKNALVLIEAA